MKTVKWNNKDVYVHHISYGDKDDPVEKYAMVGFSEERVGLFKVDVSELELDGKKLKAYLLGQVERRSD